MELKVHEVSFQLKTVKLTKALLKQFPKLGFEQMKSICAYDEAGNLNRDICLGWISGTVLASGQDYETWLLLRTGEGTYGLYSAMHQARDKYPQIYIV